MARQATCSFLVASAMFLTAGAWGQTPTCGTEITALGTVITFDSDMVCPAGFTGAALTIQADDVTVDGAGFTLTAPTAAHMIFASTAVGITITNLDISGNSGTGLRLSSVTNSTFSGINASGTGGVGIFVRGSIGNEFLNNTVNGRGTGMDLGDASTTVVRDNDLSGNSQGILGSSGPGNSFIGNNVSGSTAWGMYLGGSADFLLSSNDFTNCANGLLLHNIDSMVLSGLDFSGFNITNNPFRLSSVTNSTFSGINASGTGGVGIFVRGSIGNEFLNNTVNGRGTGMDLGTTSNTMVRDNDLSQNANGVLGGGGPGNSFVSNTATGSSAVGMSVSGETAILRGNLVSSSGTGIVVTGGSSAVVRENVANLTGNRGIYLSGHAGGEVADNFITGGASDGLVLVNSPDTKVYHNNVYGNAGWQVTSNAAIELSYGNEGNYWGRSCDPDVVLFVADTDSNSFDVVDSFPFGVPNAWRNEIGPGCGPPPPGRIAGTVSDDMNGVAGVAVHLNDTSGLINDTDTAADGSFGFVELEPGTYFVSMIVPIGYSATSPTEDVEAIVDSDLVTPVHFTLERLVLEVDTRSMGFWKHQAKANLTGKGRTEESAADLFSYLDDIQEQYDIFDDVAGLESLYSVLEPPKPPTMREKSEQHLMALMLNLSSLRIATYMMVSDDDTAGEAIDFILLILGNPGSVKDELEYAKDLAEDINNGIIPLDAERIPELE